MKLTKGKKEYLIIAFVCIEKDKKTFKTLDIHELKGYTLTDGKD